MKVLLILIMTLMLSMTAWAKKTEVENVVLTKDNVIVMDDYFDSDTVAKVEKVAKEMDARLPSTEPLYLVIDSGGGSIDAGIELIGFLNRLNRKVYTLPLFAASMGFQTVQGVNGTRFITEDGTLMSHKARGGFFGEFPGQLDSRYSYYLKKIQRLDKKAVKRTNGKHTVKSYANLIENEYWCDGQDCIDQGFADKLVNPSCDASLNGTKNIVLFRMIYEGHTIELVGIKAICPLITGIMDFNILIDGQPLFSDREKTAYSSNVFYGMSAETVNNIKKIIEEQRLILDNDKQRRIRKY
jgi:ATP-dependent protease ClpP protease subunit